MVSTLLSSALRACERNGYANLPVEFSVESKDDARFKLNEPVRYARGK